MMVIMCTKLYHPEAYGLASLYPAYKVNKDDAIP
jgi:hypothetical protein